jgi:integrase
LSGAEITRLLAEAAKLAPRDGLRPRTYRTVFGLLACTGLRPSEAVRLTRDDVDLEVSRLFIRDTKFHKSRLVPLHATATRALRAYTRVRDRHVPRPTSDAFFLLDGGRAVTLHRTETAFQRVRQRLGWEAWPNRPRPRLYDLRHRFACERLARWHAASRDVNVLLPVLSTYLGHVKVTDTYWYLTGVPSLLAICAQRFERLAVQTRGGPQ